VGVNLAAKGTFLEEIGAFFNLYQHSKFWCYILNVGATYLKFGDKCLNVGPKCQNHVFPRERGGGVWVPQDLGALWVLGVGKKSSDYPLIFLS